MKKLMWGVAALAIVATASCSKDDKTAAESQFAVPESVSDSISSVYGQMVGGYILADFQRFSEEHQTQQVKNDLVKGIRMAFSEGESDGVSMGLQVGMKMLQELKGLEERGVNIDKNVVLKNFISAFNADSLDMTALQDANGVYSALVQQVNVLDQARRDAEAAEAPEAKQNLLSGQAFLANLKSQDPAVQTTASGLMYKIDEAGDPDVKINDNTLVTLNYVGKLIDGTVFDQSQPDQPVTFSPAGTIPGFAEGLKLLSPGAKATLYIPAELAYGVNAPAQIGPNQTLVFEVEIKGVQER